MEILTKKMPQQYLSTVGAGEKYQTHLIQAANIIVEFRSTNYCAGVIFLFGGDYNEDLN